MHAATPCSGMALRSTDRTVYKLYTSASRPRAIDVSFFWGGNSCFREGGSPNCPACAVSMILREKTLNYRGAGGCLLHSSADNPVEAYLVESREHFEVAGSADMP